MKDAIVYINSILKKNNVVFTMKPLIISSLALQYYGLKKAMRNVDFIISNDEYEKLSSLFPMNKKDTWGDLSINIENLNFYRSINLVDYDYLKKDAQVLGDFFIISLEKLLFINSLNLNDANSKKDFELVREFLHDKHQNPTYVEYAEKHLSSYYKTTRPIRTDKYQKE